MTMPESIAPDAAPAIERTLELRASPERLWRVLTEADELAAWFGQRCALDLRPGGSAWFEWDDGGRFEATIEVVEPPRRFAFRWASERNVPVAAGRSTLVEFRIEPGRDGGSVLSLRESGFGELGTRLANVHGWMDELRDLAAHVAVEPWHAAIRRTYQLRSAPERVWRAISTIPELDAWFGPTEGLEMQAGSEGWFAWPKHGRFAVRIEAVEAPAYLAWSWTPEPDTALATAASVLRTEWFVAAREDGGTDLHLLETGFMDLRNWVDNSGGWDSDVLPAIKRVLGEAD
jgi:uncharacterized protein YndB with AHSA1/START domain